MDFLPEIKKLIALYESIPDGRTFDEIRSTTYQALMVSMRKWVEPEDVVREIKRLSVIENGVEQKGFDKHFKSNQSKVQFTVEYACLLYDHLTLHITTKKKWI